MSAFSNGFEYESWAANWCDRCVRDRDAAYVGCPIMDEVFLENVVPKQWTPGTDDLRDRYHCSEFEPL